MKKTALQFIIAFLVVSCGNQSFTILNVDNNALKPKLTTENTFLLSKQSMDPKYGYNANYPINLFYGSSKESEQSAQRFFNALAGPNGEAIYYNKIESCCPFYTKSSTLGTGFLDVYEVKWDNQSEPIKIYVNIYEKGVVEIPVGFSLKKK
jgi:hypothetical protein